MPNDSKTLLLRRCNLRLGDLNKALSRLEEERNKTAHTYKEDMASEVYANLPRHLKNLKYLHDALVTRVRELEMDLLK